MSIEGENQSDLLLSVTGAFSALDLTVLDAMIKTEEGRVMDVFRVTTGKGEQIGEDEWSSVRQHVLSACSNSNRSSKPAIYGVAAESEETKQRPMNMPSANFASSIVEAELSNIENTASELEAAAKDMQQSAADLVRIEQELASTKKAASAVAVSSPSPESPVAMTRANTHLRSSETNPLTPHPLSPPRSRR